jgi:hypothetical protein
MARPALKEEKMSHRARAFPRMTSAALLGMLLLASPQVSANSGGIAGYSGKTITTCLNCHIGNTLNQTSISGPTFLKPGIQGTYSFSLGFAFQAQNGGLNIAAQSGLLAVDPTESLTTKLSGLELVHSKPKPAGIGMGFSWKFRWTAPSTAGTYTLYGAGVTGNGNSAATGDNNGKTTLIVTVGLCQNNADCNDSDICTYDACVKGSCTHTKVANCCNTAADCNDGNACTNDACNNFHQCTHSTVAGCCSADSQCADNNVCTLDTCDLSTHKCQSAPISECCTGLGTIQCNDGNKCTVDGCNLATNTCTHLVQTGCCKADADCVDTNPCTTDACNLGTGICLNTKTAGCCLSAADCNDKNGCTKDSCVANLCVNAAVPGCCSADSQCVDTDPCTSDACLNNQCTHTSIPGCKPDTGPTPPKDGGPAVDGKPAGDGPKADAPAPSGDGPKPDAPVPSGDGPAPGDGKLPTEAAWPGTDSGVAGDVGGTAPAESGGCCRVSDAGADASSGLPALLLVGALLGLAFRRRRR